MNRAVYSAIALAFVLWAAMFVWRPCNFWLMMTLSTLLLSAIAFTLGRPLFQRPLPNVRDLLHGGVSAIVLYLIFAIGHRLLGLFALWLPDLFAGLETQIISVYADRGALPTTLVAALLFFPIGFGEELFWRGLVQKSFSRQHSAFAAFALTTLFYTAVHLVTGNPVLLLAAAVCGLFWGGLYWITGNLWIVVISHMIWDPLIFVWMPLV
ncbi:CPBP family intramembrane metalloprotease [candidate division KSB1 bacterium]|nr:CPBP family intramembrane metalloprotease [candidate division KSB1 bacterium]